MITNVDKLTEHACGTEKKDRVCRSRGGESCAFDGAMVVLQPIADTAHIVHGPIACCGNSWEGRGTLSRVGARHAVPLHSMGLTTDMSEMDIVYGSGNKLYRAIEQAYYELMPKAIFVYATCVSGLIGEDIESVCRSAGKKLGIPVIPVNAPGFVGPKNLGNRIAGEALLDHVIGTGEPSENPPISPFSKGGLNKYPTSVKGGEGGFINLIGEYNIAGDLWLIEPLLREAGIRVLSRITGDSRFEEITYAHRAKLNVVVCSRAFINVAKGMEKRYGIPFIEVSFFGKTEISKALRMMGAKLGLKDKTERVVTREEEKLDERLKTFEHLKGKRAVLYTGGVKSWSFISALHDLGIEVAAVGTKKSTLYDEEKMKEILGEDAPLVEDVTPKNLLRLLKEKAADVLVAGGRNQYLAVKEGYPFVDVNQERHLPYAGYEGLVNLAEQISNSIRFYETGKGRRAVGERTAEKERNSAEPSGLSPSPPAKNDVVINPLKHSPAIGAAMAFQGIDKAIPVIHGAQGCTFLGKVLLTKHFREPISLAGTKLSAEDVVMGSEENLMKVVEGLFEKNRPDLIAVLTSSLSEVKGDDVRSSVERLNRSGRNGKVLYVPTPDFEGGLEDGYAKAVEASISLCGLGSRTVKTAGQINVLAGSHLTPADFRELKEIIESFGLRPVMLPDLSALDGSGEGISPVATGGTPVDEIDSMKSSEFTVAVGPSMERPARVLKDRFDIEYRVFESISGLKDMDILVETLCFLSGRPMSGKYARQRRILVDGMRDAHFYFGGKSACIALEPDLALQTARWLNEMGALVKTAAIPQFATSAERIPAESVVVSDLFSIRGEYDVLIANSHAEDTAKRLGVPLYQMGFPVYKILGNTSRVTIGYGGSLTMINDVANLLMEHV